MKTTFAVMFSRGLGLLGLSVVACFMAGRMLSQVRAGASAGFSADAAVTKKAQLSASYGQLPMRFEVNQGQSAKAVKFLARGNGYGLFLTPNEAVLRLNGATPAASKQPAGQLREHVAVLRLQLANTNPAPRLQGLEELPGKSNYLLGNHPRRWHTGVVNYSKVQYDDVYPGINLVWYGNQQQLEHDFIVAPGADPQRIRFSVKGAEQLSRATDGGLVITVSGAEVRLLKPVAYQQTAAGRREVPCEYSLDAAQQISFKLGVYDATQTLVIDPVLLYSTFVGGNSFEQGLAIALDQNRNAYIVGLSGSTDFPGPGPLKQTPPQDYADAFIIKFNPTGTALVYATWLGGSRDEIASGIAVDKDGLAYVTGQSFSDDFPTTTGSLQTKKNGISDAFIAKLNANGTALVYATLLGGSQGETGAAITVDGNGSAYLAGSSDSTDLLSIRSATGIQPVRSGDPLYKSTNQAGTWTASSNGFKTSNVSALAVDRKTPNVLYAGTPDGVYRSADSGATWTLMNGAGVISDLYITTAVVIDPVTTSTLYVASFNGIFKSTDTGQTWQRKDLTTSANVYSLVLDPKNPATLYAGTVRGALKSTNGGETWTAINFGLSFPVGNSNPAAVYKLAIDPLTTTTLYAGTDSGVYKTTNGGTTWTRGNTGQPQNIRALAVDPIVPANVYAGQFGGGVYKSTDGGATWSVRNTGLSSPNVPTVLAIAIDPVTPTTLYLGTNFTGLFKSTDGAATWAPSNSGLRNSVINALALDPVNSANLYAGTNAGADAFAAKLNPAGTALSWLTYVGGAETETGLGIAVDGSGNAYVVGSTVSQNFSANNLLSAPNAISTDAFITKINAAGTAFVYSSRFGGTNTDSANGVAVTPAGQAVIVGATTSANFPVVSPLQVTLGGNASNDAFIVKLNAAGAAFEFATWLGGISADAGNAVALDGTGNIYVAGVTRSNDFPLRDAVQSQLDSNSNDAFVAKLNPTGSTLLYSTYLGGRSADQANGIAVDAQGAAYVVGSTASANFPVVNPVQMTLRGFNAAFVAKLGIEADLALTKTTSRNPVMVNNNFSYALIVTNRGASPATGVTVTDQLPNGLNFVSAMASAGTCTRNGSTVTCQLGNLAVQGSASISLTVTPTVAGTLTNTASVTASEPDPVPANNQASVPTTVSAQPSLYGRVTLTNGNPLAGVTVSLGGESTATQQTNSNGVYQFANLQTGGNYTVTPAFSGYSFEPPARSFNGLNADQAADFMATVCAYAIAPANQSFSESGGSGVLTVTATARCPWTATASDNWITFNGAANGSGNGTVNFTVAPASAPRVGRITIASQVFVIYQSFESCSALSFRQKSYSNFNSPALIRATDFDGDGLTDLAVLQTSFIFLGTGPPVPMYGLTILRGTANGQLVATPTLGVPTTSTDIEIGDFNGDAKPDIFVGGTVLQIFVNNGQGGFNQPVQFSTPLLAGITPLTANVNRDGKTDLFTATNNGVAVLVNNGTSFNAPIMVTLDGYSLLSTADVNRDGVTDVVTHRGGSGALDLRVYLGDGFGSFSAPLLSPIQGTPTHMTAGDFNGDGNLDLSFSVAVFSGLSDYLNSNISILLGDGTGRFGAQTSFTLEAQGGALAAADLNGDAKLDVAVSTPLKLITLLGDGTGKLGAGTVSPNGDEPSRVVTGRFNSDGKTDLAVTDRRVGIATVYLNLCAGAAGLSIAGRVTERTPAFGLGGTIMKLSGSRTASTQTDSGGNYEFGGLATGGNYTVTPERAGIEFTPASRSFNNLMTEQIADFAGMRKVAAVSAASYSNRAIAPDSIVAVFGAELSTRNETATTQPLPNSLADAQVSIGPSFGGGAVAQLFFASPSQINLLVPSEVRLGEATLLVYSGTGAGQLVSSGPVLVENVAPGIFSANANGQGVAAAVALRVKADGTQVYEPILQLNPVTNRYVALPLDVSNAAEQVFLLLFGTGIRHHSGLANVSARVGGETAEVLFAAKQGGLVGLDQVNLRLPRSLAGRGEVDIVLTVDGKAANTVRVGIK